MLKKITLVDYRCFERSSIKIKDLAVIVGKNNAGKSSFVEAVRIIAHATQKFKQSLYTYPPEELGLPTYSKGIRLNLSDLNINTKTVVNDYKETFAQIIAEFEENIIVNIYLTFDYVFATIKKNDFPITEKAKLKKILNSDIFVMPQLSLLQENEKFLSDKTIKDNLFSRLSSRNFRNQLYYLKDSFFEKFKEVAETTWDGLRVDVLQQNYVEERLELFVYDSEYMAEVGLMGSGLQMWLQIIWFICRCPENATIVLDEPDVYMHPDLQIKIFKIVQQAFKQVIIATHSVEIITSVEARNIVTISRSDKKLSYLDNSKGVQQIIDSLGSPHNLSLIRLSEMKKCLLIEGKDIKILSRLYAILYPSATSSIKQLPSIELGGRSRFDEALGIAKFLTSESKGDISTYCILDRDYYSEEEVQDLYDKASRYNLKLYIWKKKELENYLVTPNSVFRTAKLKQSEFEEFKKELFAELDKLKEQTINSFSDQLHVKNRNLKPSTLRQEAEKIVEAKWKDLDSIFSVVNGKDLISLINEWLFRKYNRQSSINILLRNLYPEDISKELKQFFIDLDLK